jgi:hypothetical protein
VGLLLRRKHYYQCCYQSMQEEYKCMTCVQLTPMLNVFPGTPVEEVA